MMSRGLAVTDGSERQSLAYVLAHERGRQVSPELAWNGLKLVEKWVARAVMSR
jgi:hypothetical protein